MSDQFIINVRIREEAELYCSFDKEQLTLNGDVVDYIFSRYKEKNLKERFAVHILCEEDIDMDHLEKAFAKYIEGLKILSEKEKKANFAKQLWMAGVGVVFIAFGLYAASFLPALLGEIISTIGAFAMWEAASIWIVENPQNRLKRRWLDHLAHTELSYEKIPEKRHDAR